MRLIDEDEVDVSVASHSGGDGGQAAAGAPAAQSARYLRPGSLQFLAVVAACFDVALFSPRGEADLEAALRVLDREGRYGVRSGPSDAAARAAACIPAAFPSFALAAGSWAAGAAPRTGAAARLAIIVTTTSRHLYGALADDVIEVLPYVPSYDAEQHRVDGELRRVAKQLSHWQLMASRAVAPGLAPHHRQGSASMPGLGTGPGGGPGTAASSGPQLRPVSVRAAARSAPPSNAGGGQQREVAARSVQQQLQLCPILEDWEAEGQGGHQGQGQSTAPGGANSELSAATDSGDDGDSVQRRSSSDPGVGTRGRAGACRASAARGGPAPVPEPLAPSRLARRLASANSFGSSGGPESSDCGSGGSRSFSHGLSGVSSGGATDSATRPHSPNAADAAASASASAVAPGSAGGGVRFVSSKQLVSRRTPSLLSFTIARSKSAPVNGRLGSGAGSDAGGSGSSESEGVGSAAAEPRCRLGRSGSSRSSSSRRQAASGASSSPFGIAGAVSAAVACVRRRLLPGEAAGGRTPASGSPPPNPSAPLTPRSAVQPSGPSSRRASSCSGSTIFPLGGPGFGVGAESSAAAAAASEGLECGRGGEEGSTSACELPAGRWAAYRVGQSPSAGSRSESPESGAQPRRWGSRSYDGAAAACREARVAPGLGASRGVLRCFHSNGAWHEGRGGAGAASQGTEPPAPAPLSCPVTPLRLTAGPATGGMGLAEHAPPASSTARGSNSGGGSAQTARDQAGPADGCGEDYAVLAEGASGSLSPFQTLVAKLRHSGISSRDLYLASQALALGAQLDELQMRAEYRQSRGPGGGGGGEARALAEAVFRRGVNAAFAIAEPRLRSLALEVVRRYADPRRGSVDEAIYELLAKACAVTEGGNGGGAASASGHVCEAGLISG
ncbi:hypothetical protein GPECTOR_9g616 [Gonium pectorale]|uniref:Uncharacterized protein n=1 Tax=Gonium pectorale TaxID=33097 RepID=A0A150GS83_GONPE|nr:hypothetical protein GPECTOR_9g616 [Gonium pectorale]|eukprot:KXZ52572.1 hypothetical protein GPECTOR_9g616 [Gonium pectorale]